jgi:hypothetical protein
MTGRSFALVFLAQMGVQTGSSTVGSETMAYLNNRVDRACTTAGIAGAAEAAMKLRRFMFDSPDLSRLEYST